MMLSAVGIISLAGCSAGLLAVLALFTTLGMLLAIALAPMGSSLLSSQWLPNLQLVIICFYGGYSGICQPVIYRNQITTGDMGEHSKPMPEPAQVKYEKSGLDQAGQKLYWQRVQDFMLESKPYLTGGLSLANLYLEVGFNSKSSFYTQFKKYSSGATPRQYLARLSDKQAG